MSALMRRAVVVLAAMLWVTVVAAAAERPPNVLLIISDDQSWTDFGFMGHPEIRTPHLETVTFPAACAGRAWRRSSPGCTHTSTGSPATIRRREPTGRGC